MKTPEELREEAATLRKKARELEASADEEEMTQVKVFKEILERIKELEQSAKGPKQVVIVPMPAYEPYKVSQWPHFDLPYQPATTWICDSTTDKTFTAI